MIAKFYFDNVQSRNILHDYHPKDMSNNGIDSFNGSSLENMIMNSNLDNSNVIK